MGIEKNFISAVVLAAGESRRMGRLKQLLPFGNSTLIGAIVDSLLGSKVREIVVVLGHQAQRVKSHLCSHLSNAAEKSLKIVVNEHYQAGMLSSLICGLGAVDDKAKAFLVALGDQPGIKSDVIDRIIDAFSNTTKGIAIPTYKRRRGHPIIIDRRYEGEILSLSPDVGLRGLIWAHPEDILEVEVDMPNILKDLDTLSDYEKEIGEEVSPDEAGLASDEL